MSERKVRVTDDSLRNLTNDCLRFTLHFFRPIQLSAQHIYHTALPLSPETSILRSRFFENHPSLEEDLTTRQASSSSTSISWGPILRTIKADSGIFTYLAVAGEKIVALCEDNTVHAYDAATGVLRLSLDPPHQVTNVGSSPDGSILFFAHQQARDITVWDTQTGGLVHTLKTISDVSDIAVSSRGKYLGSCSSEGTFEFWEVEGREKGSHSMGQAIVSICWLEPEDQVALALKGTVAIFEVTTRKILRKHRLGERMRGFTFSAYQHQLVVLLDLKTENRIQTIDIRTGRTQACSPSLPKDVSHFAFSDDGSRIIYTTNTGHLRSYTLGPLSTRNDHLGHLGTIHSMNLLRSGHLVVNSGGSIQILGLEYTRRSGATRDPKIAHVYQLDSDKAICGTSRDHMITNLLDMETMKILANDRIKLDELDVSFTPRLLCASIDEHISVLTYRKHSGYALRRDVIGGTSLWEQLSSRPILSCALSPNRLYFVTVGGGEDPSGGGDWELCVRRVLNGDVLNVFPFIRIGRPPSKITFTSGERFYIEERQVFSTPPRGEDENDDDDDGDCGDHHVQTTSTPSTASKSSSPHPQELDITPRTRSIARTAMSRQHRMSHRAQKSATRRPDETTPLTTDSEGPTHVGVGNKEYFIRKTFFLRRILSNKTPQLHVEIEEVPGDDFLPVLNPYSFDENLEWVVDAKSRRVCWLPLGWVTRVKGGHYFDGSLIVTAGQDGIVRKLMFREQRPDS